MEHLNPEAQADIKKMSSDRIRLVLAREGADLDELAKAERGTLLNMVADLVLNPNPKGEESTDVAESDDRHLLEREIKLQEAELQFRRKKRRPNAGTNRQSWSVSGADDSLSWKEINKNLRLYVKNLSLHA